MNESPPDTGTESVRIRLLKVLRLAQQGIGGERENAEVLLVKLLRKHSMTLADLGIDVCPSEHAAIVIAWEVYRAAFVEARQALVIGFCFKHGLYAAEGTDVADMSAEARARSAQALALAEVLPVVESPAHRLGTGTDGAGT